MSSNKTSTPNAPAPPIRHAMSGRDWSMLLLLGAMWGGSYFFGRVAVMEIHPLTLVFLRVAIAGLALHLYLAATGQLTREAFGLSSGIYAIALLNNIFPFTLTFVGQTELGAGAAAIINATTPFWTMILANLLTADEKLTGRKVVGIILGVSGAAIMIGPGVILNAGAPLWAKLALVGTALSYACGAIYARRLRHIPPQTLVTGQLTASTVVMLPVILLWTGSGGMFDASATVWAAVVALAVVSTSFGFILYFSLIRTAGATNASLVTLIVPVSAILLGALFLGERLEPFEFIGMGLIALGLLIVDGRFIPRR